ncbi:MAG: acyl-CoA thioesterase [Bacteroidetes bacterium]|nr:acyl-CoA thioesterase [Bacteroidota bacterium]
MITFKTKINFFDCDPEGILFYGRIFQLCHEAYEAMIESFNLKDSYWGNENFIVPIIHCEAKYRKPLLAGETTEIEITVTNLKNSSFELTYLCKNNKGEVTSNVRTVHVFVNRTDWKKTKISEEVKKGLEGHFVE